MNELIWFGFLFLDLSMVLLLFYLFEKQGVYGVIVMNIILCNIQVAKNVELFGLTVTLGNILYGSIFFSTDILSEFYGKKEAQQAVYLGFAVLVLMTIYMQIALLFQPAPSDLVDPHLQGIFGLVPRIALGSLVAYLLSQCHDIWLYQVCKEWTKGKHLWLRNNLATLSSQAIDSVVFCIIAFYGLYDTKILIEIVITTFLFKVIVALLDTPFLYLARKIFRLKYSHNKTQK